MKRGKIFLFVIGALFFAFNLLLTFIPMTNVLGFEFSVVNGITGAFLLGLAFIHSQSGIFKTKLMERDFLFLFFSFIIVSLAASIVSTLAMQVCPLDDGIYFYFIFSIPSYFAGVALASVTIMLFEKRRYPFFVFLFLMILFSFADEIYFNPQIYFFSPLMGYFPGTIYDETIKITEKIVYYRLLNLIYFIPIAVISFRLKEESTKIKWAFAFVVLIIAFGFGYLKPDLEFATSKSRLTAELKERIETEHFVIYCDERIDQVKKEVISKAHEFYYEKISSLLNDEPEKKIISFVFYDDNQKKKLFGSKIADVAKPWLNQIFIGQDDFRSTLKHELAHVFSAKYGWSVFKIAKNFNPAMIEGFATAIENDYDNMEIDYVAAFAKKNGYGFPVTELFSGFDFFGRASSISYVYSGAFLKYLLNKYGAEKLKLTYGDLDFKKNYGKDLSVLSNEFEKRLDSIDVAGMKNKAQLYFGRLPIHKKICARSAARNTEKGWELYGKGYYSESYVKFKETYDYAGSYSSLIGMIYSLKETERYKEALEIIDAEIDKFDASSYYYSLLLNYGDLLALNLTPVKARIKYNELFKISPSDYYSALASVRLFLLTDSNEELNNYLKGSDFDKYQILQKKLRGNIIQSAVPIMINLSERLKENYETFIEKFQSMKINSFPFSIYSAFELSKYAMENGDYPTAKRFAAAAARLNQSPEISPVLFENKEMINWISNH